jgi:hypothetical protein
LKIGYAVSYLASQYLKTISEAGREEQRRAVLEGRFVTQTDQEASDPEDPELNDDQHDPD